MYIRWILIQNYQGLWLKKHLRNWLNESIRTVTYLWLMWRTWEFAGLPAMTSQSRQRVSHSSPSGVYLFYLTDHLAQWFSSLSRIRHLTRHRETRGKSLQTGWFIAAVLSNFDNFTFFNAHVQNLLPHELYQAVVCWACIRRLGDKYWEVSKQVLGGKETHIGRLGEKYYVRSQVLGGQDTRIRTRGDKY